MNFILRLQKWANALERAAKYIEEGRKRDRAANTGYCIVCGEPVPADKVNAHE